MNNIGNIVIGHNNGWKQEANLGKKTNQKFVSIPFNDLISKEEFKEIVDTSYRDLTEYVFLPVLKQLLRYRKALFIVGRETLADDTEQWISDSIHRKSWIRLHSIRYPCTRRACSFC